MSGKMSSKLREQLDLQCGVCKQQYNNPRLLPCFHSFCEHCIATAIASNNTTISTGGFKDAAFRCPKCREEVELPPGGVSAFRMNVYLAAQVERAELGPTKRPCAVCSAPNWRSSNDLPASTWSAASQQCMDCDKAMCDSCLRVHDALLPTHTLTSLTRSGPIQVTKVIHCSKHPAEILRFHCLTCSIPICRDCRLTLHTEGHQCRDLSDLSQEAREVLSKTTDTVSRVLLPLLDDKLQSSNKQLEEKKERQNSLQQMIRQREEKLISLVRKSTEQALKTVADAVKVFEEDYMQSKNITDRLKNQCNYNRMVMEGGCKADILQAMEDLKRAFSSKGLNLDPAATILEDQVIDWNHNDVMYFKKETSDSGYISLQDWESFIATFLGHARLRKKKKPRSATLLSYKSAVKESLCLVQDALVAIGHENISN